MPPSRWVLCSFAAVIIGCPLGALWFTSAMALRDKDLSGFALLPLWIFDSFLFGWFPALLFGALLLYLMHAAGWRKLWQWLVAGALLAWGLFIIAAQAARIPFDLLSFLLFGVLLLKNLDFHTWPAAACGALTAAILRWVAIGWAKDVGASVAS